MDPTAAVMIVIGVCLTGLFEYMAINVLFEIRDMIRLMVYGPQKEENKLGVHDQNS